MVLNEHRNDSRSLSIDQKDSDQFHLVCMGKFLEIMYQFKSMVFSFYRRISKRKWFGSFLRTKWEHFIAFNIHVIFNWRDPTNERFGFVNIFNCFQHFSFNFRHETILTDSISGSSSSCVRLLNAGCCSFPSTLHLKVHLFFTAFIFPTLAANEWIQVF